MRVLSHEPPIWDIDQGEMRVDRTDSWTRGTTILLGEAIDLQHTSLQLVLSLFRVLWAIRHFHRADAR